MVSVLAFAATRPAGSRVSVSGIDINIATARVVNPILYVPEKSYIKPTIAGPAAPNRAFTELVRPTIDP